MTDIDTRSEARRSAERLLTLMQRGTIIEETRPRAPTNKPTPKPRNIDWAFLVPLLLWLAAVILARVLR